MSFVACTILYISSRFNQQLKTGCILRTNNQLQFLFDYNRFYFRFGLKEYKLLIYKFFLKSYKSKNNIVKYFLDKVDS